MPEPDEHLRAVRGGGEASPTGGQTARGLLPNSTETKIVVTGNARAWRHFVEMRASGHADTEIRRAAIQILRILQGEAPALFGDFEILPREDGTETASTTNPGV